MRGQGQATSLASLNRIRRVAGRPGDRYPVLCVDEAGLPVAAPAEWYRLRTERNEPRSTSDTYLTHILAVLTAFRDQDVRWNDRPEVVRRAFIRFLRKQLRLRISRDAVDGVRYTLTARTPVGPSTVNVLRAALRDFYAIMGEEEVGLYRHENPFDSQLLRRLNRVRAEARAGGDIPAPADGEQGARRQPSAFVRADRRHDWQPDQRIAAQAILDGIFAVVEAVVAAPDVTARDKAILLLLRYTGPRAFEVITLTVGGYRARGVTGLIRVTNKGDQGRLVKTLAFEAQPRVQEQLDRYLGHERPAWDKRGRRRLADIGTNEPFFLTRGGDPYTYDAFYYHWRKHYPQHRQRCPIAFTLHDIRHAFVTEHLLRLREEQRVNGHDNTWRLERKASFGRDIMGWRDPTVIETYDHTIDQREGLARLAAQQQGRPIVPIAPRVPPASAHSPTTPSPVAPSLTTPYGEGFLARLDRYQRRQGEGGRE